jgi:hypothetical protein
MTTRLLIAAVAAIVVAAVGPAVADDTGFASIHDLRSEGAKTCMSDHEHYGSSNGQRSRREAELAAIKDWSSFTDLEYGSDWAKFSLASGKQMNCSLASSGWTCDLAARPCKAGRYSVAKQATQRKPVAGKAPEAPKKQVGGTGKAGGS